MLEKCKMHLSWQIKQDCVVSQEIILQISAKYSLRGPHWLLIFPKRLYPDGGFSPVKGEIDDKSYFKSERRRCQRSLSPGTATQPTVHSARPLDQSQPSHWWPPANFKRHDPGIISEFKSDKNLFYLYCFDLKSADSHYSRSFLYINDGAMLWLVIGTMHDNF